MACSRGERPPVRTRAAGQDGCPLPSGLFNKTFTNYPRQSPLSSSVVLVGVGARESQFYPNDVILRLIARDIARGAAGELDGDSSSIYAKLPNREFFSCR